MTHTHTFCRAWFDNEKGGGGTEKDFPMNETDKMSKTNKKKMKQEVFFVKF